MGGLPGHSLEVLGRSVEQLVGQVAKSPGDGDLVANLWHGRVPDASMALSAGGQVGRRLGQQDDVGPCIVPGFED